MGFAPHSDIDMATKPTRLQRARTAALDVATSPIPSIALVTLLVRTLRRSTRISLGEAQTAHEVAVAAPALA